LTTSLIDPNRSIKMNLMHEDLARAHMQARLDEARERQRSREMNNARRSARKAERASRRARMELAAAR